MESYLVVSYGVLAFACLISFAAGLVKGTVGFAMPMIIISGLSSVIVPELALAGLIFPTLVTNIWQALRQGWSAAWESIKSYRLFLVVGGVFLISSAQLVRFVPQSVLFFVIGLPITVFAISQLMGWVPKLSGRSSKLEAGVGAFAGFIGGLSGVWGPPTVAYLTAVDTPKVEHVRVQGTIYGLGAVLLLFAHLKSGILSGPTMLWSALLVAPAVLGMWIGFRLQDRIDQVAFRKATLFVLCVVGLNLVRRGVMGA